MKNNILIFLLGIFVTISIAASIPNTGLLTVKPATPKSVFVTVTYNSEAEKYIKEYVKKGYIFKSFNAPGTNNYGVLVLEKY